MPTRTRSVALVLLIVVSLSTVVASCSKSDGSDPEASGATTQAVERLQDFGLAKDEATCIVDEVGAPSVVEATDLIAYTDGQQYQDAAEACIADD